MTERVLKVLPLGVFGSLVVTLVAISTAPAQEPIPLVRPGAAPADPVPLPLPAPGQPAPPAPGDGIEVLAKGPVHEAFASTAEAPAAAPVVPKQPPAAVEELPPDQKPEGDNVQWIPGYWNWDEEGGQFIWVSGFWRQPPPGRVWVPGAWRAAKGGWQYAPGFWQELAPAQPQQPPQPQAQPEIEYLPEPPATLEIGPTVAAPSATSVYVPGAWVWRSRYVWRPGVWVEYRRDWVWVPARYHWSPAGYVFCDGYWDYPLATRGVLFAPVVFSRPVRPAFVYTPVYVVSEPCMTGALFVRRGHSHYYFGDYFEPRYIDRGYSAWCGTVTRSGFSIGFSVGRTWGYDPLWSYYSVHYRNSPQWRGGVGDLYAGRYRGDVVRPPTTLVQQNTVINNITRTNVTNVTNNITVVNGAPMVANRNVANVAMVAPLKVAPDLQRTKFEPVAAERRREEATAARQLRDVGAQRSRLEAAAVARPQPVPGPGGPGAQRPAPPQTIKLDVPQGAVARARVANEDKAPPPNPLRAGGPGTRSDPRPQATPKMDPRPPTGSPARPAVVPLPKVDPKPGAAAPQPPTDPRPPAGPSKVSPGAPPVNPGSPPAPGQPKIAPRPPGGAPVTPAPKMNANPQPTPLPKVEPRPSAPSVNPPVAPRIDPKPAAPVPPAPSKPPVATPPVAPLRAPAAPRVPPTTPPAAPPRGVPSAPAQPRPTPPAPRPDPKPAAPVAAAPLVPARPQPAPAGQPPAPARPRPATAPPTAPPMRTVQPPAPKPPAAQPQPAPAGKPGKKPR